MTREREEWMEIELEFVVVGRGGGEGGMGAER